MSFWLNLAWWGYLVIWGALLIHCLLKRRFFPLLGRGLGTKVFWLVTFIFMNPLLTLLYVIFAAIPRAEQAVAPGVTPRRAICLVLVLAVIGVFELPWPGGRKKGITVLQAGQARQDQKGSGLQAQAGVLAANNSLNTSTSSVTSGHTKFAACSIIIRSESNHQLIDKVCRFMQEKIVELPYVKRVEYQPAGIEVNEPLSRADIMITVDAAGIREGGFGMNRTLEADISCTASTDPVGKTSHSRHHNSPPTLTFSMNNRLQHSSTFKGIESAEAKYKQQSENIAQQFVEAMTKQFDKWIEQYGLLPELPAYMYSKAPTQVQFQFLQDRNAKRIHLAGGLMTNCRTVWSYEDQRANLDVFREVRDILQGQGWRGGHELDEEIRYKLESFTMSKGNDHVQVFRARGRSESGGVLFGDQEGLQKKLPIIVEYLSLFTSEQADEALRQLFSSDADIETKLMFEDFSSRESVKQLLSNAVESQPIKTMDGYLLLGRHYAAKKDMDKATDALMMARAMSRAESEHDPAGNEIKELAKKIGDESLAKADVGLEYFQRAGFLDISAMEDGVAYERGPDEPLMFYAVQAAEDPAKQDIKTIAIRISQVAGKAGQYEVEKTEKQRDSSSRSKNGSDQNIVLGNWTEQNKPLSLQVKNLEDGRFRLTVRKG